MTITVEEFGNLTEEEFHKELARITMKIHEALNGEIIDLSFLAMLNVMGSFYAIAETPENRENVLRIIRNAIDELPKIVDKPAKHSHLYVVDKPPTNPTDLR